MILTLDEFTVTLEALTDLQRKLETDLEYAKEVERYTLAALLTAKLATVHAVIAKL